MGEICGRSSQGHSKTGPKQRRVDVMTGHLVKMLSPMAILRLAVILAAAAFMVVMNDGAQGAPSHGAACKCFVPNPTSTWSTTDPGSHPVRAATFDIGVG